VSFYVGSFRFLNSAYPVTFRFGHNAAMTAIVSTYHSNVFCIGADGLRMDPSGSVADEHAQKIFYHEGGDLRLAFALAGCTTIFSGDKSFDFIAATRSIVELVAPSVDSFPNFMQVFNITLYEILRATFGTTLRGLPPDLIVRILFVGYFNNQPCRAEIEICHQNLEIQRPTINEIQVPAEVKFGVFSGSQEMYKLFAPNLIEPRTQSAAVTLVRDYIQLCINHRGKEPDCANIDGHIHIAAITPQGFVWVIPPIS
jgi:hypothetical protein